MTATAIIVITCLLLHRSGVMNKFLTACKVSTDPEPIPETPPEPPKPETPTRPQLEAHAIYILESQGLTTKGVKYMSNRILQEIIQDYFEGR